MSTSTEIPDRNNEIMFLQMRCLLCEDSPGESICSREPTCSPSLCTSCMNLKLINGNSCPECHGKLPVNCPADRPMDYPLFRLIQLDTDNKLDLEEITVPVIPSESFKSKKQGSLTSATQDDRSKPLESTLSEPLEDAVFEPKCDTRKPLLEGTSSEPQEYAGFELQGVKSCKSQRVASSSQKADNFEQQEHTNFELQEASSERQENTENTCVHGFPVMYLCICCSIWLCRGCLYHDSNLPGDSYGILSINEALDQFRKEYNEKARLFMQELESSAKNIEPGMAARHSFCRKYCHYDIRSHNRIIQVLDSGLEELKREDETTKIQLMKKLEQLSDRVNKTASSKELISSCKELAVCQTNWEKYVTEREAKIQPLQLDVLMHLKMDLKLLVEEGQPLYAVLEEEETGKARWALVASKDNRRLLYSLRDGLPPGSGIIMPYEFVRELIPSEGMMVFFEIGWGDPVQGRVYVQLFNDTHQGRQVTWLCSGERGPSYRDTCFFYYNEEIHALAGGDYQNNDGSGGSPLMDRRGRCKIVVHNSVARLLAVDEFYNTNLYFTLKTTNGYVYDGVGMVTEGFHILQAASKVRPITNVVIRDCGLFVPLRT